MRQADGSLLDRTPGSINGTDGLFEIALNPDTGTIFRTTFVGLMRYLTLAADYTQSALRDDFVGAVGPEEVGLTEGLGDRIREWNGRYRAFIPLDEAESESSPTAERIETLDEEGLLLVNAIEGELSDAKVRYFSEGRLRYIS